jgi:histidinol-phosphate aminotransferase
MNEETSFSLDPVPAIKDQEPYEVPSHPAPVDLKLSGNEGVTPPQELLQELRDVDPDTLRSYPSARELEDRIADLHNVDPSRVLVTAGADDAMLSAFRSVLCPGRNIVVPVPTFVMVPRFARLTGAEVRELEWTGSTYPTERVLEATNPDTSVVPVVSPNNPSGATAGRETLLTLVDRVNDALIVLDHAYVEFADAEFDLTETAIEQPNVVVLRTFSKAWGLAGLRVGYAIGPERVINWMRMAKSPYAVSDLSLKLAKRRLDTNRNDVDKFVASVRRERDELVSVLTDIGAEPETSQANFVFAEFEDAEWTFDALAGQGIATRIFPDKELLADKLRITCPGDPDAFDQLERALRTIYDPEAILLDMDGVLADVSGSYRQAIMETAEQFGVEVTEQDISEAKMAGDANDDWQLTQRLMADRGNDIPLEDITDQFQALYHGTEDREGLYRQEDLLVDRAWLEFLSETYRLGIVTGRPRSDAERFLDLRNIAGLFDHMICMDDVDHLKPDPEPVQACLTHLSVNRAWFVGDTPDDMVAGREAGVLPVGVVPPGETMDSVREPLRSAGASRVLASPEDLDQLLP